MHTVVRCRLYYIFRFITTQFGMRNTSSSFYSGRISGFYSHSKRNLKAIGAPVSVIVNVLSKNMRIQGEASTSRTRPHNCAVARKAKPSANDATHERCAVVSRVFVRGFPPNLNPAAEHTTCTIRTDGDSNESWDLAHKNIAGISAIETHTYIHTYIHTKMI